jgi:hypothetical protein
MIFLFLIHHFFSEKTQIEIITLRKKNSVRFFLFIIFFFKHRLTHLMSRKK